MSAGHNPSASLRGRLLMQLTLAATILSVLLFFTMRHITGQAVRATQDALLNAAATSILEQVRTGEDGIEIDLPYSTFSILGAIREDKVYYSIYIDNEFLTGYDDLVISAQPSPVLGSVYNTALYKNERIRKCTLTHAVMLQGKERFLQITVAQTLLFQELIIRDITRNAAIIGVGFFGLSVLLALLATNSILRPINLLAGAVSRRGPKDLRPVAHPTPAELMPLMTSLNGFISRLRSTLHQSETFIAEAAHHIKTPLAMVKSECELAQRKSPGAEMREHLRHIARAVDESSRSASQLLDHAMVLYRAEHPDKIKLELCRLVKKLASSMQPVADLKDIQIETRFGIEKPVCLFADPLLIEVALRNMLDNAIKYSPPDKRILMEVVREDRRAIVKISDEGRGLAGLDLTALKGRFARGHNVGDVIGSGLGIAIILEICAALGGDFTLTDHVKGGGACATLCLPAG